MPCLYETPLISFLSPFYKGGRGDLEEEGYKNFIKLLKNKEKHC